MCMRFDFVRLISYIALCVKIFQLRPIYGISYSFQDGGYVLGAPGLREGRGTLYYSARADPTMFMLGNYTQINSVTGLADDTITDSYQGLFTIA